MFGIEIRTVLLAAAAIEGAVAWVCFRKTRLSLQVGLVLWLSTAFVLYRAGLWAVGYDRSCPCLGTITDALGIPPKAADFGMKLLLLYLLLGACLARFCLWRGHRRVAGGRASEPAQAFQEQAARPAAAGAGPEPPRGAVRPSSL